MSTLKVDDILGELSTDVINLPNKFKVGGNTIEQGYTVSTTEPSSPSEGDFWWDNANEVLYRYINGGFKDVGVSAAAAIWYGDRDLRTGFTSSTYFNDINYNSITTLGNAADFGDAGSNNGNGGGTSNSIRGIFCSGQGFGTDIEYVTIATLGNAVDFGDSIFDGYGNLGGMASPTRAAFAGGANPSSTNLIEYVQIMSTGDATDFGDLTVARTYATSVSNGHGGLG